MAKRYDIVVPRKYEKDGEEKTAWKNVGTLVRFPATEEKSEGYILELNMFPGTTFKVFEQKPKEDRSAPKKSEADEAWDNATEKPEVSVPPSEEDNAGDIPF